MLQVGQRDLVICSNVFDLRENLVLPFPGSEEPIYAQSLIDMISKQPEVLYEL